MSLNYAAEIEAFARLFPSELWWEKFPDKWVELSELLAARQTYEDRFAVMRSMGKTTLVVDIDALRSLASRLELDNERTNEIADVMFVLAGWMLTKWHQAKLKENYPSVVRRIKRLHSAVKSLDEEIQKLPMGSKSGWTVF